MYLHISSVTDADVRLREEARSMGAVCYALQARKTANLMARVYNQAVADLGIEMSQLATLLMVAADGESTAAAMAEILGVERSTLVRNLALLQRDKLIAKQAGKGRRVVWRLTARGRALAAKAIPRWRVAHDAIEARIGATQTDPRQAMRELRRAARALLPETSTPPTLARAAAMET